ncbi:hypothetical protein ZEAMMB73_Zm00001d048792 [Zea mays]|uniref:Uncharacterized protein n=1 Tax=Zea mays TaxID=4577 RepID=A0A1D6PQ43_MAIZE|nr:hypothetical protein ZEAMMB73_Zm00001d048792 [Zea mays]AQK48910.1 hypothetical protein ZEAMMB73_Zm00001d048792 [Zea mays]AQK48913.1 hypothetical protein ZEAMMB73_Zm00001d048792 [Zea mays]
MSHAMSYLTLLSWIAMISSNMYLLTLMSLWWALYFIITNHSFVLFM